MNFCFPNEYEFEAEYHKLLPDEPYLAEKTVSVLLAKLAGKCVGELELDSAIVSALGKYHRIPNLTDGKTTLGYDRLILNEDYDNIRYVLSEISHKHFR